MDFRISTDWNSVYSLFGGKGEVYWTTMRSRLRRNKRQWDISRVETDRFVTHILYNSNSKHLICWRIYNCLFIHVNNYLFYLFSAHGKEEKFWFKSFCSKRLCRSFINLCLCRNNRYLNFFLLHINNYLFRNNIINCSVFFI